MTISKTALIFLVFVVMLSVFVANISNLISVGDNSNLKHASNFIDSYEYKSESAKGNLVIADSADHLLWFLQISDIHISIFHDETRITEFQEFCDLTINAIKPSVVLASGDLTDAKSEDNMGSRQYVKEWEIYRNVLETCKVSEKTVWLDIRGNHDNFNVPNQHSKENYYRNYSVQGIIHPKSYLFHIKKGQELYSFIAMDACLDPGPRRPFNFVGVLTKGEMDHIRRLADEAKYRGSNFIIWFGHYPTSCILGPGPSGVRGLIGNYVEGLAYLCGHYHTLGGVVPNMYTLQQAGFLELELGDWKDNRLYRLLAIDHGLFSFVDVCHRDWPVALVTNPKHALYVMPTREPLYRMIESTHVRILAFSLSPITSVKARIDGKDWKNCRHVEGPLYVVPWNPKKYITGLHEIQGVRQVDSGVQEMLRVYSKENCFYPAIETSQIWLLEGQMWVRWEAWKGCFGSMQDIGDRTSLYLLPQVMVKDETGRENIFKQPFSLDGTKLSFRFLPRFVLMSNISMVFQILFGTMLTVCVLPLCILKCLHSLVKAHKLRKPRIGISFFQKWIRRLWILSTVDRLFYPLVLYTLYLTVGPWSVGEVIEGHTGIIFAWGIIINGAYLPGSFTYAYGFLQMCTFQLPLMLFLSQCVEQRYKAHIWGREYTFLDQLCQHLPFVVILTLQMSFAYFFWLAYGTMAFLLGPLRTWSVLLGLTVWYLATKLPEKCLREAAIVWGDKHLGVQENSEQPNELHRST